MKTLTVIDRVDNRVSAARVLDAYLALEYGYENIDGIEYAVVSPMALKLGPWGLEELFHMSFEKHFDYYSNLYIFSLDWVWKGYNNEG